jgi:hypothetical protein
MELETKDRVSQGLAGAAGGPATESGGEPRPDRTGSAASPEPVGSGRNCADSPTNSLVSLIRERLEQHPHFRGRSSLLEIDLIDGSVVLSGRLPSHYLKQLLQEAIKVIPDVATIHNRVQVLSPRS